jgi:hypothetical protein
LSGRLSHSCGDNVSGMTHCGNARPDKTRGCAHESAAESCRG